jgi:integrase
MEHSDYLAIRRHLPTDHQDILDFAYLTGWRRGEVLGLEWRDVDRAGAVIRLRPEMSKTRDGRLLVLSAPLRDVIERRWRGRMLGGPLVFHRDGRSLDHFKDVWRRACKAAGMPRKLFHDLRRTAVRNMVRAGIPERVAMQVSGHTQHLRPLQHRERDGPTASGRPSRGLRRCGWWLDGRHLGSHGYPGPLPFAVAGTAGTPACTRLGVGVLG